MTRRLLLIALAIGLVSFGPAALAAPANDNFRDAQSIAEGDAISTSTDSATTELLEPLECTGGSTVWYAFEATESGDVTVDTAGSDYDTTVSVYTGSANPPLWDLELVDCNDDSYDSLQASVTFPADEGQTYYIQAGGWAGLQGSLSLTIFRPGAISGLAELSNSDDPALACVSLYDAATGRPAGGTYTDYDTGEYRIAGVPAGSYKIRFSPCGWRFYATEWYDDKPSQALADTVDVAAGEEVTGIDASFEVSEPEPSPIDVEAVSMSIENVPLKSDMGEHPGTGTVRDVTVTVRNIGEEPATGYVDVIACPATVVFCQTVGGRFVGRLDPGESRSVTVRWNGAGSFGDFTVEAFAGFGSLDYEESDRNWDNNVVSMEHYVILGGTGFGIGV